MQFVEKRIVRGIPTSVKSGARISFLGQGSDAWDMSSRLMASDGINSLRLAWPSEGGGFIMPHRRDLPWLKVAS